MNLTFIQDMFIISSLLIPTSLFLKVNKKYAAYSFQRGAPRPRLASLAQAAQPNLP